MKLPSASNIPSGLLEEVAHEVREVSSPAAASFPRQRVSTRAAVANSTSRPQHHLGWSPNSGTSLSTWGPIVRKRSGLLANLTTILVWLPREQPLLPVPLAGLLQAQRYPLHRTARSPRQAPGHQPRRSPAALLGLVDLPSHCLAFVSFENSYPWHEYRIHGHRPTLLLHHTFSHPENSHDRSTR